MSVFLRVMRCMTHLNVGATLALVLWLVWTAAGSAPW